MKKEIKWLQNFENERADSVWYGDDIVCITFDDRYDCIIGAFGDIRVEINGNEYVDKANGGTIRQALMENNIMNDNDLQKAIELGTVCFENNNWFELIIWDNKEKDYIDPFDLIVDSLEEEDTFDWLEDTLKKALED
jgi:hypothetical protein